MKVLRRSIIALILLVTIVVIAASVFVATFDAAKYKPEIIEQVEKATGRQMTIDGDIQLSVFPWVGLSVGNVTLGNAPGFSAKPFAEIQQLDIKVNVLPLLIKEVQVDIIRLHGLAVSLEVDANAANNWSSLMQVEQGKAEPAVSDKGADTTATTQKTTQEATQEVAQKATRASGATPLQDLQVEGFEFVNARIVFDDKSRQTKTTISDLNLTTGAIKFDEAVEVTFHARIENTQPLIDTTLGFTTRLIFNQSFSSIQLHDFIFTLQAQKNAFISQQETIVIKSDIDVAMDEQRIALKQLQLSALGIEAMADITVSQFANIPLIQGNIEIPAFDATEVAKRAGVALPAMAKANALQAVALKAQIKAQGEKIEVNTIQLALDDSTLSGWVHVLNTSKQRLRYELAFDRLNLNDYLPPVVDAVPEAAGGDNTTAAESVVGAPATTSVAASTGDEKIELPVEMLRQLDIQGDFRVAELAAKEYNIRQLQMSLKAKQGEIVIKPLLMQVLDGQVNTAVTVNLKKAIPAYAINLIINQVQAGPVANPYLEGVMGDEPLKMEGAVDVKANIKTKGDTVNQLKQASLGSIVLDMKKTRVDGFDPAYYMRSSIAEYVHSKGLGLSSTIMGKYKPREVTVFDKIHSTIKLADGKASTDDFLMDSKRVKVTAKGHADIMKNSLDVVSSVQLPRSKTVVEKIFDEPMFVRVHGPFDALKYELDESKLKKSTTDVIKNEAKAKLNAEKQRLQDKVKAEQKKAEEKVQQKLQDTLKNKLKGLF